MYFRTLGFDVIDGRPFLDDGGRADAGAAIVNQRFADLAFPGQRAVGQRIQIGSAPGSPEGPIELRTIVGVVPSVRQDPGLEPEPAVYTPLSPAAMSNAVVLVRTKEDAASLAAAVRDEVVRIDPSVPVNRLMTLADANQIVRWNARVSVEIITTIALIALGLATLGLAALTAHAVTQRSRELGIRLALGATSGGVVRLVLERVTVQALVGVAIGCALAKAWDPTISAATLLGTSGLVIAVVIGISSWPAARAARIDPLAMLRES